jgi:F-type H+-transporting ATPase subunit b
MAGQPHGAEIEQAAAPAGEAAYAAEAGAHGGEHAGVFPPFDAATFASQLFWFALTFGALYFVVSRYVLPSVNAVLARREATVKGDLDAAAIQSAAAEDARAGMEKATAKARADARAMVDKARADMTAKLTAEQEEAEARLSTRVRAAEAKVDAERVKALAEAPAMAEALAREIADKLAPQGAAPKSAGARA